MSRMFSAENAQCVRLTDVPYFSLPELREELKARLAEDCRILAFFDTRKIADVTQFIVVLLDPRERKLRLGMTAMQNAYPAFTPEIPAMHYFEREIFETTGICPEGHPWLKPVRFSTPGAVCGVTDYYRLTGTAAHEVAVGPVHAGVIEPGHFRFQCLGENVKHLEIELGYQHRGVEKLIRQGGPRFMHLAETASGDSSAAAALAAARIRESAAGGEVPRRGDFLRRIALELERIANHIGDLGALSGDVAYLPTASYCGRIRGDFLNMTATLCGNRFGRGYVVPGGVRYDVDADTVQSLLKRLDAGEGDLRNALDLMFDEPGVLDRFENTGSVDAAAAREFGAVGMAARASGLARDVRHDLKVAAYLPPDFKVQTRSGGDVLARAKLRYDELRVSLEMVKSLLRELPAGEFRTAVPETAGRMPDSVYVSVVEAWRGELCHAAVSDARGNMLRYRIVDPSFHNWFMLAMALRGQEISDFPICNKSFNLSYCGHDL